MNTPATLSVRSTARRQQAEAASAGGNGMKTRKASEPGHRVRQITLPKFVGNCSSASPVFTGVSLYAEPWLGEERKWWQ